VPIGRVDRIRIDSTDGQVVMTLAIEEPNLIPADAKASIRLKTLLGNYHIYIDYGQPGGPTLGPGEPIQTEEYKDIQEALQDLGNMAAGPAGAFDAIRQDVEGLITQVRDVIEENRPNLLAASESFAAAGPRFIGMVDEITTFTRGLQQGRGTLMRLLNDDELYNRFSDFANNMDQFSRDLTQGQGTLPRLMHDPTLVAKIEQTVDNITSTSAIIREVMERNGENIDRTFGQLGEAGTKLNAGLERFVSIGRKIDEGEGTIGKMVNDPALYDSVKDAVDQIRRTFEEGEEQSVMRTFLGVFFGSVI
jgi:phospholipid/cholesterol/gamma-HCH transport system substrate-binding protein